MKEDQTRQQIGTSPAGQMARDHRIIQRKDRFPGKALALDVLRPLPGKPLSLLAAPLDKRGILNPGKETDDRPSARFIQG